MGRIQSGGEVYENDKCLTVWAIDKNSVIIYNKHDNLGAESFPNGILCSVYTRCFSGLFNSVADQDYPSAVARFSLVTSSLILTMQPFPGAEEGTGFFIEKRLSRGENIGNAYFSCMAVQPDA